jgi:hypothetical protein
LQRDSRSRSGQGRDERGPSATQDASQQDRELFALGRASLAATGVEELSDACAQRLAPAAESRGGEHNDQDQKNFEHIRRTSGERNDRVPKLKLFYDEPKCHNAFSTRAAEGAANAEMRSLYAKEETRSEPRVVRHVVWTRELESYQNWARLQLETGVVRRGHMTRLASCHSEVCRGI